MAEKKNNIQYIKDVDLSIDKQVQASAVAKNTY